MKLKVVQVGNPAFPRYAIITECKVYFRNDGVWTPNQNKAALYASLSVAKDDWKRLQAEMETGLVELTGTLLVRVFGAGELTTARVEELARYLSEASSFTLDYKKPRPSWLEKAVVSCQLIWDLKPKK
jgi:hypothetical protein